MAGNKTVQEMMMGVCARIGDDPDSIGEMREKLLDYFNEAMEQIYARYRPTETVAVVLDERGRAELSGISQGLEVDRILSVHYLGFPIPWGLEAEGAVLAVPGCEEASVLLTYRYFPKPLQYDGDTSGLPGFTDRMLMDYATAHLCEDGSKARQGRKDLYYRRFLETMQRVVPYRGSYYSMRIRNKYGWRGGE